MSKTYKGVRYPEAGTIRLPHCVVQVIRDNEQSQYELKIPEVGKMRFYASSFEWGFLFSALGKTEPVVQRFLYESKAAYARQRKRTDADWKRLENHQKRCRQLAVTILFDMTGNRLVAEKCCEDFSARVIEKFPEAEWTLTEEQIRDAVGDKIVLAALENLNG